MRVFLGLLFLCSLLTPTFAETLHPGDKLQVTVWQDPKLDRTVVVAPDGTIAFPLAGHIRAAGRSAQQVEKILQSRLGKKYTGHLDITVALAEANKEYQAEIKPRVYVTGQVAHPGTYIITPEGMTIVQALVMAGGVGPFAAKERIQVHRQIKGVDSIFKFNYNAFESGRDPTENIPLRSGDIVLVPERGLLE